MGSDDVTQLSVEEPFCNQGQFNSSAALTLPDFALTLHTNPSQVVRRKIESSGKEKYTCGEKRNTLRRFSLFVAKFLPSEQDRCVGSRLLCLPTGDKTKNILVVKTTQL